MLFNMQLQAKDLSCLTIVIPFSTPPAPDSHLELSFTVVREIEGGDVTFKIKLYDDKRKEFSIDVSRVQQNGRMGNPRREASLFVPNLTNQSFCVRILHLLLCVTHNYAVIDIFPLAQHLPPSS